MTEMMLQALDSAEHGVESCSTSPEAPCVVYVSKMVAVPAAALPRYAFAFIQVTHALAQLSI